MGLRRVRLGRAMTIEINRPEIEALIQQRLHSGALFRTSRTFFRRLLEMQRKPEHEVVAQKNKEVINAKIERGLAQLDRRRRHTRRSTALASWKPIKQHGSGARSNL